MAKLQIFVLVVALSQAYGFVQIVNYPAELPVQEILPHELPTVPEVITPPCVSSIRALLEAIIARLPEIEVPRPLPIDPEVEVEEEEVPEVENPHLPTPEAEVVTPCSACFEYINSLLTTAEKAVAIRRMYNTLALY